MSKIIDEVKAITANEVAKKQDAAKLNFPKILEKIKVQAALGESTAKIPVTEMNEYDKRLLESEGFTVRLMDTPVNNDYKLQLAQYREPIKQWMICWS